MACTKTVASLFGTPTSGATVTYTYIGYNAATGQGATCSADPPANCPNPGSPVNIGGGTVVPGTAVLGPDLIDPTGATVGFYYFEACATLGGCSSCEIAEFEVLEGPSAFDDCTLTYCFDNSGSNIINLYTEWGSVCANAPSAGEASTIEWASTPADVNFVSRFTDTASSINLDTLELNGLPVNDYALVFTVTTPGVDPGDCPDCTKTKTLTVSIINTPTPGAAASMTVCNAA